MEGGQPSLALTAPGGVVGVAEGVPVGQAVWPPKV